MKLNDVPPVFGMCRQTIMGSKKPGRAQFRLPRSGKCFLQKIALLSSVNIRENAAKRPRKNQERRLAVGFVHEIPRPREPPESRVSNLRQSRRLEKGGAAQSRMALRAKVPLPNLSAVGATSSEAKSRICRSSGAWKFPSGPATTMPRPRRSHQWPLVRYAINVKYF